MRVLLVTQYFHPEDFKSNDIAFELSRRGYDVTVLTGLPNYPKGTIYEGYGVFRKRKEIIDGVKVYRTLVIPRGKGGGLRLAMNYLSWAFTASIWAFFIAIFHSYDAVIVHETSPITQGFPALIVKWMQRIPMYFWVLDLWPESLQAAGNINNKYVLGFFTRVTRLMYRHSDRILMSSKGFRQSILDKGDFEDRLVYFPNWAEDVFSNATYSDIPPLPDGFKVMFAGNVGEAQDFENVMKAAKLLEGRGIRIIIVGDGRKKEWIERYIVENSLADIVFLMGRHPLELMPSFFNKTDVLFLSLKDDYIFSLTTPAKLQAYMAAGKPVVAMINGEARQLIEESGCGISCNAGDVEGFAAGILKMSEMSKEELQYLGERGRTYFDHYFRKEYCIDNLCKIIEKGNLERTFD